MTHPDLVDVVVDDPAAEVKAHLFHCPGCRTDRASWRGDGAFDPRLPDALEPDRFEIRGLLGRGGMGTVLRVFDRTLDREVAVKVLHRTPRDGDPLRDEARLTARLDHPSVIAIYHLGALTDGRSYSVMKIARGRTLRAAMVSEESSPVVQRRLVGVLQRVCDGVAFAHAAGVVHRDLKPENVSLGAFDELTIVDFGLSRPRDAPVVRAGTAAYFAPELDGATTAQPAADVFALGVMLREVLDAEPGRIDPGLGSLAARATATDPGARPTARELGDALRDWLEGVRRLDEARQIVVDADALRKKAEALREAATGLRAQANTALAALSQNADPAKKAPAWALADEAEASLRAAEASELTYEQRLATALTRWPDLPEARAAQAEHWRWRLVDAERRRDPRDTALYTALIRQEGSLAGWLDGESPVTVVTAVPGQRVRASRLSPVARRLAPGPPIDLGTTPLRAALPPGSWLLSTDDGTHLPVQLARDGRDPGLTPEGAPAVHQRPEVGDHERWVPAGWSVLGGDEHAPESLPRLTLWVDAFVLDTFPVTAQEYLAFLDALAAQDRRDEAERFVPRTPENDRPLWPRSEGGFRLPDGTGPDFPVTMVDLASARAFAAWRSHNDGLPWRLPTEYEREKAARGADGRGWPWGDHFEPAWCRTANSLRVPQLGPVYEFPDDVSVYGVRGLAGGVRDWTASAWSAAPAVAGGDRAPVHDETGEHQVVRGGAWTSAGGLCRPAARFGGLPAGRYWTTGFRLARSVP